MNTRTRDDLKQMQSLPLGMKVALSKTRIREWINRYGITGVYISWSGGKDSTVLKHLVRSVEEEYNKPVDYFDSDPAEQIPAVFVDTGLEYPEIRAFVKKAKESGEAVEIVRPEMRFDEVIKKYGYPVISKRVAETVSYARKNVESGNFDTQRVRLIFGQERMKNGDLSRFSAKKYAPLIKVDFRISSLCCTVMKKKPFHQFQKGRNPFVGTMASEGMGREARWLQFGCNAFDSKQPISAPMSFWTTQDVLEYICIHNVEIPSVYGSIEYASAPEQMRLDDFVADQYGCDKLRTTGCDRTGCIFCGFGAHLEKGESRFERLKRTHPRQYDYCIGGGEYDENGIWKPNKNGLGMGHVFDELNKIYGPGFIKY